MSRSILVLNAGSSSIKSTLFDKHDDALHVRYDGQIEGIGSKPHFLVRDGSGHLIHEQTWIDPPLGRGHAYALEQLAAWLDPQLGPDRQIQTNLANQRKEPADLPTAQTVLAGGIRPQDRHLHQLKNHPENQH